jgi:hypothetical protein
MSPANRANSAPLWEAVGNNGVCQLRPPPTSQNLAHTAIPLILAVPAVVLPIATEDARNAAVGVGALELAGQADVNVWEREKEREREREKEGTQGGQAGASLSLVEDGWTAVLSPEM